MTAPSPALTAHDSLLRRTLQIDGAAVLATCAAFIGAAGALAGLSGLPAQLLVGLGAALVPYGALLLWASARPQIDRRIVWLGIAADDLWIVGSAALLLGAAPLTGFGWWLTLALAVVVGGLGVAKYLGLRRAG